MLKVIINQIVTIVLCLAPGFALAAEIEGVQVADKMRMGDTELVLNGAGVRTRVVFKVYVGALYLPQKRAAPDAILGDAGAKRVALHMLREITPEQLFAALNDGLKANHTPEQLAKIEPQAREFEGIFKKLPSAKSGDVILLDYAPGAGTRVTVNGELKGTISTVSAASGAEFYSALLRVWLGDKPAEASLKKAMLGG